MKESNSSSRIEGVLFYLLLLRRIGLQWILKVNNKVAVGHILLPICRLSMLNRLESDLDWSHHPFKKYLKGFMRNSMKLSKEVQLVDDRNHTASERT